MNFFRDLFGYPGENPGAEDCDQCVPEPDWYRMGMTPPRRRPHDLSSADRSGYFERLVDLRGRHEDRDADDRSTGQSVDSFLGEKLQKLRHDRAHHSHGGSLVPRRILDSLMSSGGDAPGGEDDSSSK
jgi:hypothetical protein